MIADRYKSMRRTQSGLYRWKGYYWNRDVSYNRKRSENVVMDPTVKAQLFNNLRAFMKEETADKFARECIPYRKGILLYGVPGTGKTSLAAAIANELDIDMYSINMSICTDDERLFSALDELPKGNTKKFRVILLEDVDAVGRAAKTRDEDEDNDGQGVTQAGFLNFLDGVSTPDRVLFIMTTNHPDRLDPAVIRDGRCDVRLEVKALTPELQAVMIQRFFDDMDILSAFAKFDMSLFKDQVGASVQAKIVHCHEKNMTDPKDIVQFIMVDGKIGSDDDFSMFGKSLVEEVVETEDKEEGE
jgi:chaperone BCS1